MTRRYCLSAFDESKFSAESLLPQSSISDHISLYPISYWVFVLEEYNRGGMLHELAVKRNKGTSGMSWGLFYIPEYQSFINCSYW